MKSLEGFIARMVESAHLARTQGGATASAAIQKALAESGLLPGHARPAAQAPPFDFVDLNPPPARPGRAGARPVRKREDSGGGRGSFTEANFSCAAGSRRYKLYVPAGAPSGARPLVVMLHGCTQDPDDFAAGTAMNALADRHGCLVLYPEQPRSANPSGCWNWFERGHQGRGAGEPEIIAAMTRHVVAEHGADPARVFVAGLSAGGAMAAILGAEYPELFAAAGVHSGLPAGSAKDLVSGLHAMKRSGKAPALRRSVPIIVFHGDGDQVVNCGNGEAVTRQFVQGPMASHGGERQARRRQHEASGRSCTTTTWVDAKGRTIAEHWLLHGAGHAWAGGSAAGSYTDAAGPCASAEMLRFFLDLPR